MSIHGQIQWRIANGDLYPVEPVLPYDPVVRRLLVSAEINELLTGPWKSSEMERRCFQLRAVLDAFVKGDQIGVSLTPYRAGSAYMARLDKPEEEIWDI